MSFRRLDSQVKSGDENAISKSTEATAKDK